MSYRGEQKSKDGSTIYVYEAKSYWNSNKKRSEQKRVYIGTKDPVTGEFKPNEKYYIIHPEEAADNKNISIPDGFKIIKTLDYGHVFCLVKIAEQIGLLDEFRKLYGADSEYKLTMIIHAALGYQDMKTCVLWSETVYGLSELSERQYKRQKKDFEEECYKWSEKLKMAVIQRLDASGLSREYNFDTLMMELMKIKIIIFQIGRVSVTELTDMQRAIFKELGIDVAEIVN